MEHRKRVQRPHLVSLKVPNEVPSHWLSNLGHLPERFLYAILADVGDPCGKRRPHSFRTMCLGDRDDGHALTMPSPLCRLIDSLSYLCDPTRKLRKKHSQET